MSETSPILIVEARFYEDIADELVAGASEALAAKGCQVIDRIAVPGAFEIPAAIAIAAQAARSGGGPDYAGYVALGCVIRGETTHYDYVCSESARGLMELAVRERLAIGYGILTVETREQAWARADRGRGNKGAAAAAACCDMIRLKARYGLGQ
ncbi:MAG: 6,7-dimethyl-8-ribityllumazine synthase [Rhodothalassiaceae bacterium]